MYFKQAFNIVEKNSPLLQLPEKLPQNQPEFVIPDQTELT